MRGRVGVNLDCRGILHVESVSAGYRRAAHGFPVVNVLVSRGPKEFSPPFSYWLPLPLLLKVLEVVYLRRDPVLLAMSLDADNFTLAVEFDRLPRQGISKIQSEMQRRPFRVGLLRQEIDAGPADIASDGLLPADMHRNPHLDAL